MAIFYWRGNGAGTKTDMQDGRNWVNQAGTAYASGVYPGATAGVYDDVVFDSALASGASSPTTNCDFSAKVDWNSMRVASAYDGDIGASGGWLKAEIGAGVWADCTSAGACYFYGSGTDGYEDMVIVGGSNVNLDGEFTDLQVLKGTVTCQASVVFTDSLTIGYLTSAATDVSMTIAAGATMPATVNHRGGAVTNSNAITTLNTSAGTWTQSAGNITTWTNNGATCYWNGGNVTTLYVNSGSLSAANGGSSRVLGTATIQKSATLNLDNGLNNIIVSNYVQNYGGTYTACSGARLTDSRTWTIDGSSDAQYGIDPQSSGAATLTGDMVYVAYLDTLECYYDLGASDSTSVIFKLTESTLSDGTGEADISGKTETFTAATKSGKLTVRGDELTATKPYVRVNCVIASGSASLVSAHYALGQKQA